MRVLMLGNSFTAANGLAGLIAGALGGEVVAHTRGGARLSEHLNPNTRNGRRTAAALAAGGWDFVVMQEMSTAPVRTPKRFVGAVCALGQRARGAGAAPVLFATWPFREGSARLAALGIGRDEMQRRLHAACVEAARESGSVLADVGTAFCSAPSPDSLYAADGAHPSTAGTALAAEVIVAALRRAAERGK